MEKINELFDHLMMITLKLLGVIMLSLFGYAAIAIFTVPDRITWCYVIPDTLSARDDSESTHTTYYLYGHKDWHQDQVIAKNFDSPEEAIGTAIRLNCKMGYSK